MNALRKEKGIQIYLQINNFGNPHFYELIRANLRWSVGILKLRRWGKVQNNGFFSLECACRKHESGTISRSYYGWKSIF